MILSCKLIADERGIIGEILLETKNASSITYKVEVKPVAGKTAWCQSLGDWSIATSATTTSKQISGNQCYNDDYVFYICYRSSGYNPKFWITLNELTVFRLLGGDTWTEILTFYIDYRDCRYPTGNGSRDIGIMIDGSDDGVYYRPGPLTNSCAESLYTEIDDEELLNFWEVISHTGSHDISCMCPIPDITSIEADANEHPVVSWSHDDDSNGSYDYEVWRLLTQFSRPYGTWYLIDTVTDVEEYTDVEIYVGSGSWGRAYYKVKAIIDDLESPFCDEEYIEFQGLTKPLEQNANAIEITEFKLQANYPNPFNPSTKISFDILEQSPVELTVYDIQGQKVVTLVNETLDRGNYSVEFNAGQLPSGTYLYKIVAGDF